MLGDFYIIVAAAAVIAFAVLFVLYRCAVEAVRQDEAQSGQRARKTNPHRISNRLRAAARPQGTGSWGWGRRRPQK